MDLNRNLFCFCHYFTYYCERVLHHYRHVLEKHSDLKENSTSSSVTLVAGITSVIPTVGSVVGIGITEGVKYIKKVLDRNTALGIASIVYSSMEDKEALRKKLVEGAYLVFSCYEFQFSKVTCKYGGVTAAMQKIAEDAANRLFSFLPKDDTIKVITGELVAKGILYGVSMGFAKHGRTLNIIEDSTRISTSDFFTKCGIRIEKDGVHTFYSKPKFHVLALGHRKLFDFEDLNQLKGFEIVSPKYSYKYQFNTCDKQQEMNDIFQYIVRTDPFENRKELQQIKDIINKLFELQTFQQTIIFILAVLCFVL